MAPHPKKKVGNKNRRSSIQGSHACFVAEFEKGKRLTFYPNKMVNKILHLSDGFQIRTAEFEFKDGSTHFGFVEIDMESSGEHWGTGIYLPQQNELAYDRESDFLQKVGKIEEEVYPYRYRYHRWQDMIGIDIHIEEETGWSRP